MISGVLRPDSLYHGSSVDQCSSEAVAPQGQTSSLGTTWLVRNIV